MARAMLEQLFGVKVLTPPKLMPRRQTTFPDTEKLQPVPEKYLRLIGAHAAHPGTGMGYSRSRMRAKNADATILG